MILDPRDAVVRVTLGSICTSDLHIKHGSVPRAVPGITVGHEMVGVVEEVGSATSDNGMLLKRWSNYVGNGYGGNKELVTLVIEKGFDYVQKYFQYSILENYNAKIDDHAVLKREAWWKDTLHSRQFGYHAN